MKIFNAMFSKVNGGLEQVFLNYTTTLNMQGDHVVPIIHPAAQIRSKCPQDHLVLVHNFNQYDPFAVRRLRRLIERETPDCVITHTYRAAYLFKKTKTKVPKVAVCHVNSHYDFGADAIIALTESMRQGLIAQGCAPETVFTVPNMIRLPSALQFRPPRETAIPVIGACARFSANKGIDVLIEALAELKRRKISFRAKIAGDGREKERYVQLIQKHQLQNKVALLGWVEHTDAFYESIDLFCLPSREETFGLVILEAMKHALPMVLSALPGPLDIVGETQSALLVEPDDPMQLADALSLLITQKSLAHQLALNAFERVKVYSSEVVGSKLHHVLAQISQSASSL